MTEHTQGALPPKTCSIERLVTNEKDVQKVLEGLKTATRRNGRYADVGEVMVLEGREFTVEQVFQETLGDLNEEKARQEGYDSVENYKQAILKTHPGMPWLPHMNVWVHEFKEIQK